MSLQLTTKGGDEIYRHYLLTREDLDRAVRTLAEQHPQIFGEVLAGTWIDEHADLFLQLEAFGKVMYK